MHLNNIIPPEVLHDAIEGGLVSKRKHPQDNLWILNYTPKALHNWIWNQATINCRGLIVNQAGQIMQRPFKKFFTLEQYNGLDLPKLYQTTVDNLHQRPFITMEKYDGSLGILYKSSTGYSISTRGSFESDQAAWGTEILKQYDVPSVDPNLTLLFEIIDPRNTELVVHYGDRQALVLLAVMNNATGEDDWEAFFEMGHYFPLAELYNFSSLAEIRKAPENEREGYVLYFDNGIRLKYKFAKYIAKSRLVNEMSPKNMWAIVRQGILPQEYFIGLGPEQYEQAVALGNSMIDQFNRIKITCEQFIKQLDLTRSRKTIAQDIIGHPYQSVLFCMLDKKNYQHAIWKSLKPSK